MDARGTSGSEGPKMDVHLRNFLIRGPKHERLRNFPILESQQDVHLWNLRIWGPKHGHRGTSGCQGLNMDVSLELLGPCAYKGQGVTLRRDMAHEEKLSMGPVGGQTELLHPEFECDSGLTSRPSPGCQFLPFQAVPGRK
ncbi:hypothetical protein H1C71_026535 [Ictidomys tridecemlineatus]|nr:hypothetical protein H1C71_026535 [Ictidomys tridecemlineatus]